MLLATICVIYAAGVASVLALAKAKNRACPPSLMAYEDREQMRMLRRRAQRHSEEVFKTAP
jgi:hypothetical protein